MSIGPVNKGLPIPLYHQIKQALMDAIVAGEWQSGQQLPNEDKLAGTFCVSKITVRQALQDLSDRGSVRREQGRGTFVSKPRFDQGPRELTSFSEEMERHGLKPSSRLIECKATQADEQVASALQIPAGGPVFMLKRLRLADAEPMGIQVAYLPVAVAPGLMDEDVENVSLYHLLQSRYGVVPFKAREKYFVVPVDPAPAHLLGIAPGSPVLAVDRTTFQQSGTPFEFVRSIMRGDRYSVSLELVASRPPVIRRRMAPDDTEGL